MNGLGALQQDATLDASSASVEIGRVGGKEGLEGVPAIPSRSRRKAFSMRPVDRDELENVRVPRPPGVPEWGYVPGVEEAPVKGQRKEDRWV